MLFQVANCGAAFFAGLGNLFKCRFFIVEQIGPFAPRANFPCAINDIGLFQATLHLCLGRCQQNPQITIGQEKGLATVAVQEIGKRISILIEVKNMLLLIGLRRRHRVFDHATDAFGKPPFKANVYGKPSEDGDCHGRNQRQNRKGPCQPEVQPRAGGLFAARCDHAHHTLRNQRGHRQNVNDISKQNAPQRRRGGTLICRSQDQKGCEGQKRPQTHQPPCGNILHTALAAQTPELDPVTCVRAGDHPTPQLIPCRKKAHRHVIWPIFADSAANRPRYCGSFTSTFAAVSREYPDQ